MKSSVFLLSQSIKLIKEKMYYPPDECYTLDHLAKNKPELIRAIYFVDIDKFQKLLNRGDYSRLLYKYNLFTCLITARINLYANRLLSSNSSPIYNAENLPTNEKMMKIWRLYQIINKETYFGYIPRDIVYYLSHFI